MPLPDINFDYRLTLTDAKLKLELVKRQMSYLNSAYKGWHLHKDPNGISNLAKALYNMSLSLPVVAT